MRKRILDSASRLLVDVGYSNLSMRKVAQKIGYSATTIYHHFDSKTDLFHALVDEGMRQLGEYLSRALDGSGADPTERLESLCLAYVRFGLANPEYYEVMFVLSPANVDRYPVDKYRRARTNLDVFARAIAKVTDDTFDRASHIRMEATVVWASLHGIVSLVNARRIDRQLDTRALTRSLVARLVGAFHQPEVV